MKILIATGLTGWGIGGVQTETIRLVSGLRRQGVDVALVIDHLPEALDGVQHFAMEYPPRKRAGTLLRQAVDAFSPELLHVIGGGIGFLGDVRKLNLKCPWVFTAHNVPPFERILHRLHEPEWLHYRLRDLKALPSIRQWKSFLRSAPFDRVVAHSDPVIDSLQRYGCPNESCVFIPLGVDVDVSSSPVPQSTSDQAMKASIDIVTVSGIAHHKGIHSFLQAFILLSREFPTAKYHIVGQRRDETYLQYLQKIIADHDLSGRVQIYRNATTEVRDGLLDQADLYVQPSHEEGFCLAMMEAARRVPRLLGTRSGAIALMLQDDPASAVVDIKSSQQLADASATLLRLKVDASTIRNRVERLARTFSWDRYLDAHLRVYETLCKQ